VRAWRLAAPAPTVIGDNRAMAPRDLALAYIHAICDGDRIAEIVLVFDTARRA